MWVRIVLIFATSVLVGVCQGLTAEGPTPEVLARCKGASAIVLDQKQAAIGTAFCIDKNGYFITNAHVVSDLGGECSLVIAPGEAGERVLKGKVLKASSTVDLAIVAVDGAKDLVALPIDEQKILLETMPVVALGYPFGNSLAGKDKSFPNVSVNMARITSIRKVGGLIDMVQIDSQLNPGNSGGPIVDMDGNVVAMARATVLGVTKVGVVNTGINLAIPASKLNAFLREPSIRITSNDEMLQENAELVFSLTQFGPFQSSKLNVEVQAQIGESKTQTAVQPNSKGEYRVALPLPKRKLPSSLLATAEFVGGLVRGRLENTDERLADLNVSLAEITSIRKENNEYVVRLVSGATNRVPTLPKVDLRFKLAGRNFEMAAADVLSLELEQPRIEKRIVNYEIVARDGELIVGKFARVHGALGLIPLKKTEDGTQLYDAERVAHGKTVKEIRRLEMPGGAEQILFAASENRIFIRNIGPQQLADRSEKSQYERLHRAGVPSPTTQISILDAQTGNVLGVQTAKNRFTDFDLSPDGGMVYAADYGGERIGYTLPAGTHYVHRYNFGRGEWQVAQAPKIAWRIEAISADRFVLQEGDQWISLSTNKWPVDEKGIIELLRRRCGYAGNCEYDPFLGRLLHGSSGGTSDVVALRWSNGKTEEDQKAQSTGGQRLGGAVLNSDGHFFFHDAQQFDARDLTSSQKTFSGPVIAASADLAFTALEVCDIKTGEALQRWESPIIAAAVTLAGDQLVTCPKGKNQLIVYEIQP
jgi:S1-C subfamily serine protease